MSESTVGAAKRPRAKRTAPHMLEMKITFLTP